MESYNIKELAMMTGLTTRTLRNYLRSGLLNGDKIDGMWQFTAENISDFISNPIVKPSIQAKNKAIIFNFLADDHKKEDSICTILDLHVSAAEADKISAFFCEQISHINSGNIRFSYERNRTNSRIILSGSEEAVQELLNAYYKR